MKKISILFSILFVLLVWNNVAQAQIAAWDFSALATVAGGVLTWPATTWDASFDAAVSKDVTRGAGATGTYTGAAHCFRTNLFKNDGIATTNTDYFQVTLEAASGLTLSLSTIDAMLSGTQTYVATLGVSSQFAYSLDGTNFTLINSAQITTGTVPHTLPQISLTGISDLQNVPAGTTVYLRYYASGQTTTGGWGYYSAATAGTKGLAIGGSFGVLPVELSSFTGNSSGRNIQLNWTTQTELSFEKFEIERATVGVDKWAVIGSVRASGNSNSPKSYAYSDKNLQAGKYAYRMKMYDNDGSFKFSPTVEAGVNLPSNFALNQNYPNPFNPSTKISYSLPNDSKVTLDVYNIAGVKVGQIVNQEQSAGFYSVDFSGSSINKNLTSGVYLYRLSAIDKVSGKDFSSIKKMVLLK